MAKQKKEEAEILPWNLRMVIRDNTYLAEKEVAIIEAVEGYIKFLTATEPTVDDVKKIILPSDTKVEEWFSENIDADCSASSAIFKFRQWLNNPS